MARNLKLAKTRCLANREGAARASAVHLLYEIIVIEADCLPHSLPPSLPRSSANFRPAPLLYSSRASPCTSVYSANRVESGVKFHVMLRETDTRRTDGRTQSVNPISDNTMEWPPPTRQPSDRYATYAAKRCRDSIQNARMSGRPALSPNHFMILNHVHALR